MKRSATRKFPRHYRCLVCDDLDDQVEATIRIFSGNYGGGFATCDDHAPLVIDRALEVLKGNDPIVAGYVVTARLVEVDKDGHPWVGRVIWEARRRVSAADASRPRSPGP